MDREHNTFNNEHEETELIYRSMLTDMITEVLLMCQKHFVKLNRERVRRCRERNRQTHRADNSNNKESS